MAISDCEEKISQQPLYLLLLNPSEHFFRQNDRSPGKRMKNSHVDKQLSLN